MVKASIQRPAYDWPGLLFLVSALLGLGIAYDRALAWPKFLLITGGIGIGFWFAHAPERVRLGRWGTISPLSVALNVLPAAMAVFFLLTNDWGRWEGKLGGLSVVGQWFAKVQITPPGIGLNPNVAGGIIAAFLPLQAAALRVGSHPRKHLWLGSLLLGLSGVGLLLSASRGAWLALAVATGGWTLWELSGRIAIRWQRDEAERIRPIIWSGLLLAGVIGIIFVLVLTPWGARFMAMQGERPAIWRNSRDLLGDYLFTGLGLCGFQMAYSSYVFLVHVGYITHAHNLFLDIWLEQGLLGLVALVWFLGAAVWSDAPVSRWRPAALTALAVILMHGLIDDAFYGYGGWGILLLFIPFAMLARLDERAGSVPVKEPVKGSARGRVILATGSMAVVLIVVATLIPQVRAAFQANLGALVQTRAELSAYRWPQWPIQDAVRRSPGVNLSRAISYYQMALALDPANVTANRRLGQLELSRGEYKAACQHLQAAYTAAPSQRASRQLWGECNALAGDTRSAVMLWQTIDVSQQQLVLRRWWYLYIGDQERASRMAGAEQALNNRP